MPSVALRVPVVLKPGREEPWTPLRIVQALIAAGCPREAFSLYPTDHEGAATILGACGRALLFGDEGTTRQYAADPRIQIHGPGRSKVLLGADAVRSWRRHLPVLLASVADNGGRSCINASTIFTPSHGEEIADGLARELASILPLQSDDDDARLASFANPKMAAFIEASIEAGLAAGGAEDVTARHRVGPRSRTVDDAAYVLPTVVLCAGVDHPLARTEFLFPFVAVVEVPQEEMVARLGPSLVVTAVTEDAALIDALFRSPDVDRINVGPIPTSSVEWDQPHEGNLFEFLYRRRAVQWAALDPMAADGSAEGSP
jgi:acyl-CoA reductase-like NAD-dependent aldehyde dehydrogenase